MSRIAVIVGHPRTGSLCEALGQSYVRSAHDAGHDADLFVAGAMKFDPILHEGFEKVQPLEPDLQALQDSILHANHLVLIFPLWFGGLPALMKGLLERVLQPRLVESAKQKKFVPRPVSTLLGTRNARNGVDSPARAPGCEASCGDETEPH